MTYIKSRKIYHQWALTGETYINILIQSLVPVISCFVLCIKHLLRTEEFNRNIDYIISVNLCLTDNYHIPCQ